MPESVPEMTDARALELLRRLVEIPSVSRDEELAVRYLVGEMRHHGFEAHADDAGNAVGTIGEGDLTIALVGHIDTVPGHVPIALEDGVLSGRGTVDAKGPLMAFVAAAARVGRAGVPIRIVVIGCVEEEWPTSAGAREAAKMPAPDFLVVGEPSSWDGITLGYKGYLRATLSLTDRVRHTAHDAETVAARACNAWGWIRNGTEAFNAGRERAFERLQPALIDVRCSGDGVEDRAELDLTLRLPLSLPPEAAEAWLRERAGECEVDVLGALPAWSGPRTTPLHRALARAIRERDGTPRFQVKTGTADLNILAPAWGCPALAYGPGDAALDHTPEERVEVAEFLAGVSVLERTIAACAATGSPQASR